MKVKYAIEMLSDIDPEEEIALMLYTIDDIRRIASDQEFEDLPVEYALGVLEKINELYDKRYMYGDTEINGFVQDAIDDYFFDNP